HIGDDRDGITSPADDLVDNVIRALLVDIDTGHRGARLSKGQRREPAVPRALRDVARTRHNGALTGQSKIDHGRPPLRPTVASLLSRRSLRDLHPRWAPPTAWRFATRRICSRRQYAAG